MTDPHSTPETAQGDEDGAMVARFLAATSTRPAKHVIDDEDFVAMVWRMVRALERRGIANPAILPQTVALAQRLSEVTNVIIAANAERYAVDERSGASMAECARILGVSVPAASQRRKLGKAIIAARTAAAGVIRFAEARRERDAIKAAAAHAESNLLEFRARRSA